MSDILTQIPDSLKDSRVPFFKVSCGCIGWHAGITHQRIECLPPETPRRAENEGQPMWYVIYACDSDGTEDHMLCNGSRCFQSERDYTPFTQEECADLVHYFNRIIRDGHKWRDFCARVTYSASERFEQPKCLEQ